MARIHIFQRFLYIFKYNTLFFQHVIEGDLTLHSEPCGLQQRLINGIRKAFCFNKKYFHTKWPPFECLSKRLSKSVLKVTCITFTFCQTLTIQFNYMWSLLFSVESIIAVEHLWMTSMHFVSLVIWYIILLQYISPSTC